MTSIADNINTNMILQTTHSALTIHRASQNQTIDITHMTPIINIEHLHLRKLTESFCINNTKNFNIHKNELLIDPILNNILNSTPFFKKLIPKLSNIT